jgi:hypothetical protein
MAISAGYCLASDLELLFVNNKTETKNKKFEIFCSVLKQKTEKSQEVLVF